MHLLSTLRVLNSTHNGLDFKHGLDLLLFGQFSRFLEPFEVQIALEARDVTLDLDAHDLLGFWLVQVSSFDCLEVYLWLLFQIWVLSGDRISGECVLSWQCVTRNE